MNDTLNDAGVRSFDADSLRQRSREQVIGLMCRISLIAFTAINTVTRSGVRMGVVINLFKPVDADMGIDLRAR